MSMERLYREIVLDHYRNPRNFVEAEDAFDAVVHENPSCGDSVKILAGVADHRLGTVKFHGRGCAISIASASIMTGAVEGKTVPQALEIVEDVLCAMNGEKSGEVLQKYGDMAALAEVRKYPVRVKCAILPWNALKHALLLREL